MTKTWNERGFAVAVMMDVKPDFRGDAGREKPYSVLSVFPGRLGEKISQIVDGYFQGIKQIVFLGEREDYLALADAFDRGFRSRDINPAGNSLAMRYRDGLRVGEAATRTFQLEFYLVPQLPALCPGELSVMDGRCGEDGVRLLEALSAVSGFNARQYLVEHADPEHNTLVEAGAGTGKTFSMVSRVAFLCNRSRNAVASLAGEIAMVTFTNDAAANMKVRLKQMFESCFVLTRDTRALRFAEDTDRARISTIHSFALDILRGVPAYTGLGTNFRIASNEYLRGKIYDSYLNRFLGEMERRDPGFYHRLPVPIYELKKKLISITDRLLAKSVNLEDIEPAAMGETVDNNLPHFNELLLQVALPAEREYMEAVHLTNCMDLKECIILLNRVLDRMEGKLPALGLRYLFIDEFQDTDDMQIEAFQKLQRAMAADCRLFVVGDLKQSIYRFRGAGMNAFDKLKSDSLFPWDTYHLVENYRTDRRLLDRLAVIFQRMGEQNYLPYAGETDRLTSAILAGADEEALLTEVPCHTKKSEEFLDTFADVLRQQQAAAEALMRRRHLSREERTIAILVRNNWQISKLVNGAGARGIRIETQSGGDLFQIAPTLDLYKLVSALVSSADPVRLAGFIESHYTNLSLDYRRYRGMSPAARLADLERILDEFFLLRLHKTWRQLIGEAYTQPVLYVLKQIYDALKPWKQYSFKPQEQRYYMINYEYLLERMIRYSRSDALTMNRIAEYLRVNIVTRRQQAAREIDGEEGGVRFFCTTVHKSKGLEYGTVVLPYTYDDIGDVSRTKLDAAYAGGKLSYTVTFKNKVREHNSNYSENREAGEQIAEESRILYVALTRAIRNCVWLKDLDRSPSVSWGALMGGEACQSSSIPTTTPTG